MLWWMIPARIEALEEDVKKMSTALESLEANENALEAVGAAVIDDNAKLHAELTAALATNDGPTVQVVADKLAAEVDKLRTTLAPAPGERA